MAADIYQINPNRPNIIMVKFSNKAKGRPTKRRTLKDKYKIERKVRQYKKKMKKESNKLKSQGIKPKKNPAPLTLPNSFPFKQQLLNEARPKVAVEPEIKHQKLDSTIYDLITLEAKSNYFPADKTLLTKRYLRNHEQVLKNAKFCLQILDARDVNACKDAKFRKECKNRNISIVSIVTKVDTVSKARLQQQLKNLSTESHCVFSYRQNLKKAHLQTILAKLEEFSEPGLIFVAGKRNTGKHCFLSALLRQAKCYESFDNNLAAIQIAGKHLIDTPIQLEDDTEYPLFVTPMDNEENSLMRQEELVFQRLFFSGDKLHKGQNLNRDEVLIHYQIQDYNSIDDLLKKVGKATRVFGKGGMVNVNMVRKKVLIDWYTGKLNGLLAK